jgi:hypothetical protein
LKICKKLALSSLTFAISALSPIFLKDDYGASGVEIQQQANDLSQPIRLPVIIEIVFPSVGVKLDWAGRWVDPPVKPAISDE